ncbi:MAG: hypothetical protein JXB06_08385 [Spirochaetales bacterium]|nr:hypothetical protein [Spirochaetales bacterium]
MTGQNLRPGRCLSLSPSRIREHRAAGRFGAAVSAVSGRDEADPPGAAAR